MRFFWVDIIYEMVYFSRCQVYTGRFCSARLVYISRGRLQYQRDRRLSKVIKMVKNTRCQKQLVVFHCNLNYPSCTRSNEKPRTVCREDCLRLEKKFCRRDVRILGSLWHQSVACSKLPWTNCRRIFDRGKRVGRCVHVGWIYKRSLHMTSKMWPVILLLFFQSNC